MTNKSRPTSPHLQIYRWNISSITSIMHRATGVALFLSVIAICWYMVYFAYGVDKAESMETCDCPINAIIKNLFSLVAIGTAFALYYHLCNGIRHLFWDLGKGFELKTAKRNGYFVLLISLLLTVASVAAVTYLKFF